MTWHLTKTKIPLQINQERTGIVGFINFRLECDCHALVGVQAPANQADALRDKLLGRMELFFAGVACDEHTETMQLVGWEFEEKFGGITAEPEIVGELFQDFEDRFELMLEPLEMH